MTTFSNMFHMDKSTREKNMIIGKEPILKPPMSTPPEFLPMDKIIQEKNIEPVSFQNWHWQKNSNLQN